VTDCLIGGNGGDGMFMGGSSSRLAVADSRIVQNVGDGIEVGSGYTVDRSRNAIVENGGYRVNDASTATINCQPGSNLIAGNASGVTANGTNCTNGSPSQDNQN
jgi:hypothetical protein